MCSDEVFSLQKTDVQLCARASVTCKEKQMRSKKVANLERVMELTLNALLSIP